MKRLVFATLFMFLYVSMFGQDNTNELLKSVQSEYNSLIPFLFILQNLQEIKRIFPEIYI